MKKIMMIAAMLVAVLSANAQNEVGQVTLKPMVGLNLATLTGLNDNKVRVGLAAGAEAEFGVAENFGITAGVLYSMQGTKWSEGDETLTYKMDYINIPILANYYVTKGLAIKAGLQPAFKASAKVKASEGSNSISGDLEGVSSFTLSIPFGLSYEYASFVFDARYNLGVTKVFKENGDKTPKNSVFMFSVGYKFAL